MKNLYEVRLRSGAVARKNWNHDLEEAVVGVQVLGVGSHFGTINCPEDKVASAIAFMLPEYTVEKSATGNITAVSRG